MMTGLTKSLFLFYLVVLLIGCLDTGAVNQLIDNPIGEKIGLITSLARRPIYCETSGELIEGSLNGDLFASSESLSVKLGRMVGFGTSDSNLLIKIQDALIRQYEVKIRYRNQFIDERCRSSPMGMACCDDIHILVNVERVN